MNLQQLLWVALGSALGGSLRFGVTHLTNLTFTDNKHFYPTIAVNLIGSFCIGLAFAFSLKQHWQTNLQLFLIVGILGGFTTFSSYSLDILRLINTGEFTQAISYAAISLIGGLLLCAIGFALVNSTL